MKRRQTSKDLKKYNLPGRVVPKISTASKVFLDKKTKATRRQELKRKLKDELES